MKKHITLVLRLIISVILIQTLRFKFTGHPDSVYIFSQVGLEPFGRIGIGIIELIAAILILIPKTSWLGALMSLGVISGAVMMHLTQLGIEVQGDGGLLFYTALLVWALSVVLLWKERKQIPFVGSRFG